MAFSLGIIGAGNMAEAIIRGILGAQLYRSDRIIASDPDPQRRLHLTRTTHVRCVADNAEAALDSDAILLCVKPQSMSQALEQIRFVMTADKPVISIAAGVSTRKVEYALGAGNTWRVVRAMPNTPMLVGRGMTAIARGSSALDQDVELARKIFESAGKVIEVPENLMNAVTAISGSGPAYFFHVVEGLIRAGTELGLSPEQARLLATETAAGSIAILAGSTDSPEQLRRRVTSPGGTTQAAMKHLEAHRWLESLVDAVKQAEARGHELGA